MKPHFPAKETRFSDGGLLRFGAKKQENKMLTIDNPINVKDAAELLKRSEFTVRRLVKNREIACIRVGTGRGRIAFTEDQLRSYIVARTFDVKAAA